MIFKYDKSLDVKDNLLDVESVKLSELKNYVKEAVNHHYQSTDPYKIYLKSGMITKLHP